MTYRAGIATDGRISRIDPHFFCITALPLATRSVSLIKSGIILPLPTTARRPTFCTSRCDPDVVSHPIVKTNDRPRLKTEQRSRRPSCFSLVQPCKGLAAGHWFVGNVWARIFYVVDSLYSEFTSLMTSYIRGTGECHDAAVHSLDNPFAQNLTTRVIVVTILATARNASTHYLQRCQRREQ